MAGITDNTGTGATRLPATDYLKITVWGFALSALWANLHSIILPLRLLDFVSESQKNTYLGLLTFAGLVLAMIVQPIAGAISDRSHFRWGRRRPFILAGTIMAILLLPGIGLASSYPAIFAVYCLLQVSANTAQGPYQALIPDLIPREKRGRASGVKSLLEIAGGGILLYPMALFMDRYSAGQGTAWLWLAMGILACLLAGTGAATVLTVKESPGAGGPGLPLSTFLRDSFRINLHTDRTFVWFLVSRLLVFMAFTTVQTFALYFLRDVVGVANPAAATAQFSLIALGGMLLIVYPAGRLSDRIGRQPIAITSGLLGALGITLIFLFQHNYIAIALCGGLVGVSFGAFVSTNWALATDLAAHSEVARYLGLANLANAGGAALARLMGPVIDFFNRTTPGMGYSVMLVTCAILFTLGALVLIKVRTSPSVKVR